MGRDPRACSLVQPNAAIGVPKTPASLLGTVVYFSFGHSYLEVFSQDMILPKG